MEEAAKELTEIRQLLQAILNILEQLPLTQHESLLIEKLQKSQQEALRKNG